MWQRDAPTFRVGVAAGSRVAARFSLACQTRVRRLSDRGARLACAGWEVVGVRASRMRLARACGVDEITYARRERHF